MFFPENYQLALRVVDVMAVQLVTVVSACSFENKIGGHEVRSLCASEHLFNPKIYSFVNLLHGLSARKPFPSLIIDPKFKVFHLQWHRRVRDVL